MARVENSGSKQILSQGALSILEVAERLFAAKGFDAVSITDIALQADVSKANIFHHFKSKQGLYLAVLKTACSRSVEALNSLQIDPPETPLNVVRRFFSSHLRALLEKPDSTRLIQWELMENGDQRGKRLAEEVFAETFSKVVGLVRDAQDQGVFRTEIDASLLAFLLVGTNVIFFETRGVLRHLPEITFAESPDRYSSEVFELLAQGFKKRR